MVKSSVVTHPAAQVERLMPAGGERCACCGGPTLPVLEWRGEFALCNRCSRFCKSKGGKFAHVVPARIDGTAAHRAWSVDLGFKTLGT